MISSHGLGDRLLVGEQLKGNERLLEVSVITQDAQLFRT